MDRAWPCLPPLAFWVSDCWFLANPLPVWLVGWVTLLGSFFGSRFSFLWPVVPLGSFYLGKNPLNPDRFWLRFVPFRGYFGFLWRAAVVPGCVDGPSALASYYCWFFFGFLLTCSRRFLLLILTFVNLFLGFSCKYVHTGWGRLRFRPRLPFPQLSRTEVPTGLST